MNFKKVFTTLAVCFAAGVLTAACSSAPGPAVQQEGKSAPPPSRGVEDARLMDPLPEFVLPVLSYTETDGQRTRALRARYAVIDDCLNLKKVDFRPEPVIERKLPSLMAGRYGPTNQAQADLGYHFNVGIGEPAPRQEKAPPPAAREAVNACSERAVKAVPSLAGAEITDEIKQKSYIEATGLADVVKVFKKWSTCMLGAGYSYASPMDAMRDARWNWESPTADREEISVARRDVECKQKSGVARAWFEGEVEVQRAAMVAHQGELDGVKKQIENRDRAALRILDGGRAAEGGS
ncbi:hypothetical protein OG323_01110 [Streptomyces cyaneofuscatus]|uniref:hypothetical protein n=1 Tax=Streptomyces cyaneofuscatus TaxID=66883 RepID=UPI003869FF75|nr:hypothetical protein OG323_01110 [Streptomyces cyaneofuscatus]